MRTLTIKSLFEIYLSDLDRISGLAAVAGLKLVECYLTVITAVR